MTITRDDLEAKARQVQSAVEQTTESARNTAVLAGIAVAAVVLVAFVYGRRRGSRKRTLIEVYRV